MKATIATLLALAFAVVSQAQVPYQLIPYAPTGSPSSGQCLVWNVAANAYTNSASCGGSAGSPPANTVVLGANSGGAFVQSATTGTGSTVVLAGSPSLTTPALDVPTSMDALNVTDVQAAALVGTVPVTNLPGSSVRSPNSTSVSTTSADNGNVVTNNSASATAVTMATIDGTSIIPNAYQLLYDNVGTGLNTFTPSSSTTINTLSSDTLHGGDVGFIFADGTAVPGNYLMAKLLTRSSSIAVTDAANTFTGTQTTNLNWKGAAFVANGIPGGPVSGQGYTYQSASHQISWGTDTSMAGYFDGNQNLNIENAVQSELNVGSTPPLISWSGSGCTGQPADTSTASIAGTLTNGSPTITATNTFAAGDAVYFGVVNGLAGSITVPAPYSASTIYYVIATGLSGSGFQVSTTPGGSSVGNVTGTTATVVVVKAGNYLHEGGNLVGSFTVPATGTYVAACVITMTFQNAMGWGYKCRWDDEGGGTTAANLTQVGHTKTTASASKSTTAVASGDVISYMCGGYR